MKRLTSIISTVLVLIVSNVFATQTLYFPHIASNAKWETEICLINTSATRGLTGSLMAYDNSGKLLYSAPLDLAAGVREEIVVGKDLLFPDQVGYILFESSSDTISGYTKFYIDSKYRVAIPATLDINSGDIFIPHIASNTKWWTGISLLNTTASSKELTIEFSDGTTKTRTIAAGEHQVFAIKKLFGNTPQPAIKSGVIKNGAGLVGLELFGSNEGTGENYLSGILLKDETTDSLFYPHIAKYETWWTGIVAYNPSTLVCDLSITPYQKDGTALASQVLQLSGKQKYIGSAKTLNFPLGSAWFKIDAAHPITGFELFGSNDGRQLGGYTGVGISGMDGIFPKIEKQGWTGIAFVNIENKASTVTITAHDNSGAEIATETLSLAAHEKIVNNVGSLFSSNIDAATYVRYSATSDIVGFQLNGSDSGMLLDALPGDTVDAGAPQFLISKIIGSPGGTLEVDDFYLTIPAGIFTDPVELELYKLGDPDTFETEMFTDSFRVTGIPDGFPDTLLPGLRYSGPLSDESFIVVGEEVFISSQSAAGMAYHLIPATPDSGFLTYVPGPPASADLFFKENFASIQMDTSAISRFLDFSGITGWKTYVTQGGQGHFAIYYPAASVTLAQVTLLGQNLETAYNTYETMGFSYANRTGWPVDVTVKKLGSEEYGLHGPSMWGHNSATLQFNRDKLGETAQVATTAGHEFFHLVQYLYDPRNVVSRAKLQATHHWLNEACAVWAEEKFSPVPDYVSDVRAGHVTKPFDGMHAGAVTGDATHHGYGMSAFIKFLENEYGSSIIRDIYLKIFDTLHPVEAINTVTSHNLVIDWEKFLREYVSGNIYGVPRAMFSGISSGLFRIQSETDVGQSFTEDYPDLSAKLFTVRLDDPDISPSKGINFAIDQDVCDITLFKFRVADAFAQYLSHSTSKKLALKDLRVLTDDGYHLMVMVTNSNFFAPYTHTKSIKLDILVESMAAAVALVASPGTLDADGTSTSTITATVTDDIGDPVEGETVTFTTDSGSLSAGSAVTNSSGIASVNYIAPASAPPGGISTITATTTNTITATAVITVNAGPSWLGWPEPQWCPVTSDEYKGGSFNIYPPDNPDRVVLCTYWGNARLQRELPALGTNKEGWRKDYFESGALKYEVLYVANNREGTATYFYESGSIDGQAPYVNGLIEGNYVGFYENGQIRSVIPHISDLRNGMAHWFYDTGERMYDDPWQNDLRHGIKKAYYRSGPLKYEHPYTSGKKNGMTKGYYENGNRSYETPYIDGKKNGVSKAYWEINDQLKSEIPYTDDVLDGTEYFYFVTGELDREATWVDGVRHGDQKYYYKSGQVAHQIPWQDGVKHGQEKWYSEAGEMIRCENYDNGIFTGSCLP